jgi:hypothetical protein
MRIKSKTFTDPSIFTSQAAYTAGTVRVFVAVAFALSVTLTVIEVALVDVVGVPEMTPPELSDNPAGSVPDVNAQI